MRILIAEDDPTSLAILTATLSKCGYDPLGAVDGAEALEILQRKDAPRLAILDWLMPGLDGPEVCRRIRSQRADSPPFLILLTSRDGKADIVAGLEAGADDYLTKPFDPGELRARVDVGRRLVETQDRLAEQVHQLREAMAQIRTLEGIVPICGHCKKIRDDQGFWEQVDMYVARHSHAIFSHGICPQCVEKYHPDIAAKVNAVS